MAQEATEGQSGQNSSPAQQSSAASAESYVTPALEAKFKEVFGDSSDSGTKKEVAAKPQKLSSEARYRATQANDRKTAQRREFFGGSSEDEQANKSPAGNSEESTQNRSQPLKRADAQQGKPAAKNGTPASSAQQQSSTSNEEGDEHDDDGQDSGTEQTNADDDTPTLSPVLRHAARRAGFTDEDAKVFFDMDPVKAEGFFQKMHDSFNGISAQYAQLGQQTAQPQGQPQQRPAQQQAQQQQTAASSGDPVEDLITAMYGSPSDKLAKDYNPEFVEEYTRKPAKWLHENVVAPMRQMQAFYQGQQKALVAQEVTGYTKGLESDFKDLYGTQKSRSKEQEATLNEMYQQADMVLIGAQRKGVQMSVSEALERAHAMVASKFLENQTRKRIVAQVQRRSSQITQRPTQRKTGTGSDGGPVKKTEQGALDALTARMQELGIG